MDTHIVNYILLIIFKNNAGLDRELNGFAGQLTSKYKISINLKKFYFFLHLFFMFRT